MSFICATGLWGWSFYHPILQRRTLRERSVAQAIQPRSGRVRIQTQAAWSQSLPSSKSEHILFFVIIYPWRGLALPGNQISAPHHPLILLIFFLLEVNLRMTSTWIFHFNSDQKKSHPFTLFKTILDFFCVTRFPNKEPWKKKKIKAMC